MCPARALRAATARRKGQRACRSESSEPAEGTAAPAGPGIALAPFWQKGLDEPPFTEGAEPCAPNTPVPTRPGVHRPLPRRGGDDPRPGRVRRRRTGSGAAAEDAAGARRRRRVARDALAAVDVEPEDSAIFRETMAWASAEGLDTLPLGETIAALGRRFVGAPVRAGLPGSAGARAPGGEPPFLRLRDFVESMLALAGTLRAGEPTMGGFVERLAALRYRTGVPAGYPSRLHYFSDWIATNAERGLVEDVTREPGRRTGRGAHCLHVHAPRRVPPAGGLRPAGGDPRPGGTGWLSGRAG